MVRKTDLQPDTVCQIKSGSLQLIFSTPRSLRLSGDFYSFIAPFAPFGNCS